MQMELYINKHVIVRWLSNFILLQVANGTVMNYFANTSITESDAVSTVHVPKRGEYDDGFDSQVTVFVDLKKIYSIINFLLST